MKAIILAAGEGTRLKPITETRPKALIPILCRPILDWHLEALFNVGVEEVYLVISYMKEKIIKHVESRWGLSRIKIVDQGEPRGTGDAIIKASEVIGPGEDVLIAYSDVFLEDWQLYRDVVDSSGSLVIGVVGVDPRDYGALYLTSDGYLDKIIEKPQNSTSNIVNAGIYRLNTKDVLENRNVPISPRGEYEAVDLINRIATTKRIKVYLYQKRWIDVGKPWHVIDANKIALEGATHEVRGHIIQPVYMRGRVYIGEDSVVYPFTTIEGPVYIGRRVEIGPSAYIRPYSVICDGSKIGFSVEVKESVLFENVHAHHLAYIGDSVICEDVNLGAGTVLANLRHDRATVKMVIKGVREDTGRIKLGAVIGAGVRTGVNVSIMPGVKIGSNSWILPGIAVYRDVPSNIIYPQEKSIIE